MFGFRKKKMLGITKVLEIRKEIKNFLQQNYNQYNDYEKDPHHFFKNPESFFSLLPELFKFLQEKKKVLPREIDYSTFQNAAFLQYELNSF